VYQLAAQWFWVFAEPGRVLLTGLLLGIVLLWTPWARTGRWLASLALVVLMVIAVFPVGSAMISGLENRFPQALSMPPTVDGIIVLGGTTQPGLFRARGRIAVNDNAERLIEFAQLGRRYENAHLIFTGGGKSSNPEIPTEADVAKAVLEAAGLDTARVQFEDAATNTYENAVLAADLVNPSPGQSWVLVTSASHMPRAVGSFRAAGWEVIPYPVDFTTGGVASWRPRFKPTSGLASFSEALHEWVGLATYRILGRTDALFPNPVNP
jgi:uncharacterized SAM-binding protein YcdF (DUF218 family)